MLGCETARRAQCASIPAHSLMTGLGRAGGTDGAGHPTAAHARHRLHRQFRRLLGGVEGADIVVRPVEGVPAVLIQLRLPQLLRPPPNATSLPTAAAGLPTCCRGSACL